MRVRHGALSYPLMRTVRRRGLHTSTTARIAAVDTDATHAKKYEGTIVLKGPRFGQKPPEVPQDIVYESVQSTRTYDLNRPGQGNALTPFMVKSMREHLALHNQRTDAAKLIILRTRPPGSEFATRRRDAPRVDFCVGDDRFVNPTPAYLREQYQLLDDLYRSVPVVACVDGRAEDIGAAVALSCPFRIATSTTAITPFGRGTLAGMHGGCVNVLSKLDFFVGRYLGLTGATVRGADAFHAGLCTVYMPRERLSLLHDRLNFLREHRPDVVAAAIQEAAFDPGLQTKFRDDRVLEVLAVCFSKTTVEDLTVALQKARDDGSMFAREALDSMKAKSPLALKVTLKMLLDGRGLDAQSCLEMGYRVAYNAHKGKDRLAALATLDDVTDDVVNALFNDIGGHELGLGRVLPLDRRPVKETVPMDVVLRDNLLEWYNRQWYDSDGPKEEPKADGAPVLSATLPPYGPLTIAEVAAAMEKAGSKRYEAVAKQLALRLAVPGNAARLKLLRSLLLDAEAQPPGAATDSGDGDGPSLLHTREH